MPLIELKDIRKTYHLGEVDVPVLKGVSLTVDRGELVALMGASGSGKSTLMNILGCLDRPTSGSYMLDGQEISTLGSDDRAHGNLLVEGKRGVAGIHSVRLSTAGADYLVRAGEQPGLGQCIATIEEKEPLDRMVPLFDQSPVDLIVRALGRRRDDPAYEAAISATADFVVLGVTA